MSSDPKLEPSVDRNPTGGGIAGTKVPEPGAAGIKEKGSDLDREPQGTERGYDEAVRTPGGSSLG